MHARSAPRGTFVLLGQEKRLPHQAQALVGPKPERQALVDERLDDDLRETEALAQLERALDVRHCLVTASLEEQEPAQLGRDCRNRLLVTTDVVRGEGALQLGDGLLDPSRHEEDLAQPRLGAGRLRAATAGLEDRDRLFEQSLGLVHPAAHARELSRPREGAPALDTVVGQPRRPLERPLRLERGGERGGTIGSAGEPAPRLGPDGVGVGRVGVGLVCVEVVHGDHLGDLVRIDAGLGGEEGGDGQVAGPPVAPRDRLVRDALDERLQEAELSALGRERVGLDGEQLLAHEASRRAARPPPPEARRAPRGRGS